VSIDTGMNDNVLSNSSNEPSSAISDDVITLDSVREAACLSAVSEGIIAPEDTDAATVLSNETTS